MSKKIIEYIENHLSEISPDTVEFYRNKFEHMSDKEIKEYFDNGGKVRLYVNDKDVTAEKLDNLVEKLNIVKQEKVMLPYKNNSVTKAEWIIFPVQIRRLQQLATKQSISTIDVNRRSKVGQASGEDRTGKLSDTEMMQMVSMGLKNTLTELMSPRSDNMSAKKQMNEQIRENLTVELSKINTREKDRSTIQFIDAMYKCINLATDWVDYIDDIS